MIDGFKSRLTFELGRRINALDQFAPSTSNIMAYSPS